MTTPSNGERIRAGIDAFNAGNHEAVLDFLAEDVEWKRIDGLPDEGGTLHGREAVRAFLEPEVFERPRLEPLELVEDESTVLIHAVFHARGAASGIELDTEAYLVYKVEDGLARRVESWRDRADAERSAGLTLP